MNRLGSFMRFGVIATAWWAVIGGGYFALKSLEERSASTMGLYELCIQGAYAAPADTFAGRHALCGQQLDGLLAADRKATIPLVETGLLIAALIAALGWIFGVALYWSARWIWAGRKRPSQ